MPLSRWKIVELADGVAAAFCAKVLGDLGAEVIKVEPPGGHHSRLLPHVDRTPHPTSPVDRSST